jgi:hypothetical protein
VLAMGPQEMLQSSSDVLIIIDYVDDLLVRHEGRLPSDPLRIEQ